jgi:hypothetical protein
MVLLFPAKIYIVSLPLRLGVYLSMVGEDHASRRGFPRCFKLVTGLPIEYHLSFASHKERYQVQ